MIGPRWSINVETINVQPRVCINEYYISVYGECYPMCLVPPIISTGPLISWRFCYFFLSFFFFLISLKKIICGDNTNFYIFINVLLL